MMQAVPELIGWLIENELKTLYTLIVLAIFNLLSI